MRFQGRRRCGVLSHRENVAGGARSQGHTGLKGLADYITNNTSYVLWLSRKVFIALVALSSESVFAAIVALSSKTVLQSS